MSFMRGFPYAVPLIAVTVVLTACGGGGGGGGGGGQERLSIATGGTGGVYYPLGGGLAREITQNIEGAEATAEVTSASVDNMKLIANGDADIAFVLGDTAADAVNAEGPFEGQDPIEACALARLYTNFTQVVTTAGSRIETIEDLRGKRVSLGSPGSGTEVIALRVLEAAGIDPENDIEKASLGASESADALRDGTIDAFFWSGGVPTGAIVDLAATKRIRLLPTAEYGDELRSKYGEYYEDTEIPAGSYDGQNEAIPTIGVPNVLVVSKEMDEDLQRNLTALLFDQKEDLVRVHPEAKNINVETADDVGFMDICPGSQGYYDEAGG